MNLIKRSAQILRAFAVAFIFFAMVSGTALELKADDTAKPNIVFIFADDWGWGDLGCHGHPYVKTPNIDRLAKEGTDFHRFTVASGVCSPSCFAFLSGKLPASAQKTHVIDGPPPLVRKKRSP